MATQIKYGRFNVYVQSTISDDIVYTVTDSMTGDVYNACVSKGMVGFYNPDDYVLGIFEIRVICEYNFYPDDVLATKGCEYISPTHLAIIYTCEKQTGGTYNTTRVSTKLHFVCSNAEHYAKISNK
jgi:hypothetical protein